MFGKIAVLEFILMLAMAAAGVEYFKYSQEQIATLHENNAKLETAVNTQQETIKAQQAAAQAQNQQMITLQQNVADAESKRRDFEDKLRQKDIAAMARANAADLEIRMNRATIKALQDMINLTTPKDRDATPVQLADPSSPAQSTSSVNAATTTNTSSSPQPPPRPPKNYKKTGSSGS